jgi:hypothetical protein
MRFGALLPLILLSTPAFPQTTESLPICGRYAHLRGCSAIIRWDLRYRMAIEFGCGPARTPLALADPPDGLVADAPTYLSKPQ